MFEAPKTKKARPQDTAQATPNIEREETVAEVADLFDLHPHTLLRWIRENGCPHDGTSKTGYRLNSPEIAAWMRIKGKTGGTDAPPARADAAQLPAAIIALLEELNQRRHADATAAALLRGMAPDLAKELEGQTAAAITAQLERVANGISKLLTYDPKAQHKPAHTFTAAEMAAILGVTPEDMDSFVRMGCPHSAP